jgi:hypothetical protein
MDRIGDLHARRIALGHQCGISTLGPASPLPPSSSESSPSDRSASASSRMACPNATKSVDCGNCVSAGRLERQIWLLDSVAGSEGIDAELGLPRHSQCSALLRSSGRRSSRGLRARLHARRAGRVRQQAIARFSSGSGCTPVPENAFSEALSCEAPRRAGCADWLPDALWMALRQLGPAAGRAHPHSNVERRY